MNMLGEIMHLFGPRRVDHETVEARIDNAEYDLRKSTNENVAVTQLLDDTLRAGQHKH